MDYHDKKATDEQLTLNTSDLRTQRSGVVFEGQRYSVGDVVLLSFYNEDYLFGLVSLFWHSGDKYIWLVPS